MSCRWRFSHRHGPDSPQVRNDQFDPWSQAMRAGRYSGATPAREPYRFTLLTHSPSE